MINSKTAKAVRKALGFHPANEREYNYPLVPPLFRGQPTVRAKGTRGNYQNVKRNPVLCTAVLRAA